MPRPGCIPAFALAVVLMSPALAQGAQPTSQERAARLIAVLRSDAPLQHKCEACRQLAAVGGPEATPVLAGLLADPKLSHMARYALEPNPDPAAGKALREALATLKGELLIGVVHSVGMRRDAEAVGALARLLEGTDTQVAAAAAGALGRIATPAAAEALARPGRTAAKALRAAVADASLRAAQSLLRRGQRKQAAAIYVGLRAAPWAAHVRLGAFRGLLAADPAQAPARVMQAVAGDDPLLRATAIAQIPTLRGTQVVERFAAELPRMPPDVQVLLIRALARRPDAKAALRPVVTAAVESPRAAVRLTSACGRCAASSAGGPRSACPGRRSWRRFRRPAS